MSTEARTHDFRRSRRISLLVVWTKHIAQRPWSIVKLPYRWSTDFFQLASPASASMHPTMKITIASESKPVQTHELKLSVVGGWWEVGTTLSSQHDTNKGKRGMLL